MARKPFSEVNAKGIVQTVALLERGSRVKPAAVTLTSTANAAAAATTITITSVTTKILKGQAVNFVDPAGNYFLAIVDADYTTGTSLTVKPLLEAIPNGSAAKFPCEARLKTTADISSSTPTTAVDTYDHVYASSTVGALAATYSMNGVYSIYDPTFHTLRVAELEGREVYIERELPSEIPGKSGLKTGFAALVTSSSSPAPNGSFVALDYGFTVQGGLNYVDPE